MDMTKQSIAKIVPVLLTRPEFQSQIFVTALFKRFGDTLRPLVAPLMAPQFLAPEVPAGDYAGVIFTSVMGVEGAVRLGVSLPRRAFCVGRRTAVVAEAAGFAAWSADRNADALVATIVADRPVERLLYIRGAHTTGDVSERLDSAGIGTELLIVYRQVPQALSAESVKLLQVPGDVILPLFSPRSAALCIEAMPPETRATLHIAAMSAAVADAAAALPHATLVIARQPDANGMLEAIENLLATASPP